MRKLRCDEPTRDRFNALAELYGVRTSELLRTISYITPAEVLKCQAAQTRAAQTRRREPRRAGKHAPNAA
jgi:hypothetical protein